MPLKPRTIPALILLAVALAAIPPALIALNRSRPSGVTGIHPVLDMVRQPKFRPQRENPMFADGRELRPPVSGSLSQSDLTLAPPTLNDPDHPRLVAGFPTAFALRSATEYAAVTLGRQRPADMTDQAFAALTPPPNPNAPDQPFYVRRIPAPIPVTPDFLQRGRERYDIYCAPCHGLAGFGDGMIARRAEQLQTGVAPDATAGWAVPTNYHADEIRNRPDGHLFNTITHGIRTMPRYDKQIPILDRWAIVAYVRALQASQNATTSPAAEARGSASPTTTAPKPTASGRGASPP